MNPAALIRIEIRMIWLSLGSHHGDSVDDEWCDDISSIGSFGVSDHICRMPFKQEKVFI